MVDNKIVAIAAVAILCVAAGAGAIILITSNNSESYDIVIACGTKNCYEPFWIADHYGYFEKEGVKVKMLYVDGGGSATTALLAGRADLTLVGADPAIRMFNTNTDGMVIGMIEASKKATGRDFAVLKSAGVNLKDPSTLLNRVSNDPLGEKSTIKVRCGLDTTTGYYSGYIEYLYNCFISDQITEAEYKMLKNVKTGSSDGGIVHISFDNQVSALITGEVQMLCSGNTVSIASNYSNIVEVMLSPYDAVGCCVMIASGNAIANKSEPLTKVMAALDKACAFLEDPKTQMEAAKYCQEFYGVETWTIQNQKEFLESQYWDICQRSDIIKWLNQKAVILGSDISFDCSNRITDKFLKAIHGDNPYIYDVDKGILIRT